MPVPKDHINMAVLNDAKPTIGKCGRARASRLLGGTVVAIAAGLQYQHATVP